MVFSSLEKRKDHALEENSIGICGGGENSGISLDCQKSLKELNLQNGFNFWIQNEPFLVNLYKEVK